MARIDTLTESNGPDRFNLSVGCSAHNAGVRTGIKDYACCCDPCQYARSRESANNPEDRLCCRCSPRVILAKFEGDVNNDCCRSIFTVMRIQYFTDDLNQQVMRYTGSILGHHITVYLSNEHVEDGFTTSYGSSVYGCRWTIRIPSLGIDEEIAIDHITVTCLGVPSISIENVTSFESCVGTISLLNYATVKVPFQERNHQDYFADGYGVIVPFPSGYYSDICDELPRFICVTKREEISDRIRSWKVVWWNEFVWNMYFVPYHNSVTDEDVIGVWIHTPTSPSGFVKFLYLVQDMYGECWLQPDFAAPHGVNSDGETYERVSLASCGCKLKILDVRPIVDYSSGVDFLGIDYRAGRCGCWSYLCGQRRCVNQYFCGYVYVNQQFYGKILFTWDNYTKCWLSSGGEDIQGYPMPFSLSVCLQQDGTGGVDNSSVGGCQLAVSYPGYALNTVNIGDSETILAGSFEGYHTVTKDFFALHITTSFDGTCYMQSDCTLATPCAGRCGSHPLVLHATFHGWSEYTDIPPPPTTGECTTEITMFYWQKTLVTPNNPLIFSSCGYIGYAVVSSTEYDMHGTPTAVDYFLKAELSIRQFKLSRRLLSNPSAATIVKQWVLDEETCDPYFGLYESNGGRDGGLQGCFFGDYSIIFHRWTLEIIE